MVSGLIELIVGLVSPTVTLPPKYTGEPLIVIAPEPVSLALFNVPLVILDAEISATLNVPKPTIYNSSFTVAPELSVIVLPSVAV